MTGRCVSALESPPRQPRATLHFTVVPTPAKPRRGLIVQRRGVHGGPQVWDRAPRCALSTTQPEYRTRSDPFLRRSSHPARPGYGRDSRRRVHPNLPRPARPRRHGPVLPSNAKRFHHTRQRAPSTGRRPRREFASSGPRRRARSAKAECGGSASPSTRTQSAGAAMWNVPCCHSGRG